MEQVSNIINSSKSDIVHPLTKKQIVVLEHHPNDSRLLIKDDGICQTLNSRMGTGGGNVPLILEIDDMYVTDSSEVGITPPLDAHYYLGCGARGVSKGSL